MKVEVFRELMFDPFLAGGDFSLSGMAFRWGIRDALTVLALCSPVSKSLLWEEQLATFSTSPPFFLVENCPQLRPFVLTIPEQPLLQCGNIVLMAASPWLDGKSATFGMQGCRDAGMQGCRCLLLSYEAVSLHFNSIETIDGLLSLIYHLYV